MSDDRKNSAEQLFPETRDWSAVSEELAQQLNSDASFLAKKFSPPSHSGLAAQIVATISSEKNSGSQPISLHVMNEEASEMQAAVADSSHDVFLNENPTGRIVIDRAESLEWLKISAAAMLFLAVTASTIWYSSQLTENGASPVKVANESGSSAMPRVTDNVSHGSPLVATKSSSNLAPINAAASNRGVVRVEEVPMQRNLHIGEVAFDANPPLPDPKQRSGTEAEMLRSQLSAFEQIIQSMQREIEDLRRETTKLQKELTDSKASERKTKPRRLFGAKD